MQALLIMELEHGFYWLMILISGTAMTDTGAYLIGKRFGQHSFFNKISPSKTIEGAVGGLVLGALTLILVFNLFSHLHISFIQMIILAVTFPIVAQGGDLLESALKRQANVKDSGNIIPGHGGVLDRLDSIVFNVALLYHFIKWIGT
jgi:phosphatidate cytidylyltransferase